MNEVYVIAGGEWLRNNLNAIAAFMGTRTWDSIEKIALTLSVLAVAVMWVQRHNVMDLLGWVEHQQHHVVWSDDVPDRQWRNCHTDP
ncbi:conjugal transfer protein TraG N-terminal domain-containing protein [Escherichia coli]